MRVRKDQRGFTIVELLIAVAILSIVVASVCGFILVGSNSYATANSDINVQQSAQLALNQMSDVLIDTTRSVNYLGYDAGGTPTKALKDAEFTFMPEDKSLVMYNGVVEENMTPAGTPTTEVKEGNGNRHYHFYWSREAEKLYYAELKVQPGDVDTKTISFPAPPTYDPSNPTAAPPAGWVELATHVTDFSVDLTQVEEKRVVMLALTFKDGKKEYVTSNNVTIRNKVGVNDAELDPLDKKKSLAVKIMDAPIVEPGETFHFSTPKVTGKNVADKSVTWSVTASSSPSGGTIFTDPVNGILKVASDEPAGTVEVTVTTNARDSENKQASDKAEVAIKRVTNVNLSSDAPDSIVVKNEKGEDETVYLVSPGGKYNIYADVTGYRLEEVCSVCDEDTVKDKQVIYEGNPFGRPEVWRVYSPKYDSGLNPGDANYSDYDPREYARLTKKEPNHAVLEIDANAPTGVRENGVTHGFVVQAYSLLSAVGNDKGRQYDWVPGAIKFQLVKGKEPALPLTGGELKYGSREDQLPHNELQWDADHKTELRRDGEKLITAIHVVDNNNPEVHKVILFDQGGRDTRIFVDLFDLDLNGSYTFYMQVFDAVPRANGNQKADTYDQIWREYNAYVGSTPPYEYTGTRYDHGAARYAKLDKPKVTYTYDGVKYIGEEFWLRPVDLSLNNTMLMDRLKADEDGFIQVDGNTVMNNMKYTIYKGEGSNPSSWEKLVYFDSGSLSYKKGDSNLITNVSDGSVTLGTDITIGLGREFFMQSSNGGNREKLHGTYHIVPGITYRNKEADQEKVIWWDGFKECPYTSAGGFKLTRENKYYEFDDSTFHVKLTDKYTMDITHDKFTGRVMFPSPDEMKKDWRFPNMNLMSPGEQTTTGPLTVTAKRENGGENKLTFTYVKYHYVADDKTWVVEPVEVEYRQGKANVLVHSYGKHKWSAKDEKWICFERGTTKERPFKIQQFDLNSYTTYRADFPLPTDSDFPFAGGTGEKKCTVELYDSNMNKVGNVPIFTVSCKKNGEAYEIEFRTETRDDPYDSNNHKINVKYYGTYTWNPSQTVWTRTDGYREGSKTDLVTNLTGVMIDNTSCRMYFPLPSENGFPFKGSVTRIQCTDKHVAYAETDKYGKDAKHLDWKGVSVKYENSGGVHKITFVSGWNDSTVHGIFEYTSGYSGWRKVN